MNTSFLVLCPFGLDEGLLTKAVELAEGSPVRILIPETQAFDAATFGAKWIHTLPAGYAVADEATFARWLKERILLWKSNVILAPATTKMRNVMPMLAWHLQAGLTADCSFLQMQGGLLIQTRPAFGNCLMAEIQTVSHIQMATVSPGAFRARKAPVLEPCFVQEEPWEDERVKLTAFAANEKGQHLRQARIVVAGGGGIGCKEGFEKLQLLCEKLGAALAASRNAVDAGFAPYRCQVGITGATISPQLYIAVGISGAVQHLSGMSTAKTVIAINSDPKAPIFDYADIGIVGDWETVIDKMLEELL